MRRCLLICIGLVTMHIQLYAMGSPFYNQSVERMDAIDSLPLVFSNNTADLIDSKLRTEAILKYNEHQLPSDQKSGKPSEPTLEMRSFKKQALS
jgi:hypothetical protein